MQAVIDATLKHFTAIDVVVNNAGYGKFYCLVIKTALSGACRYIQEVKLLKSSGYKSKTGSYQLKFCNGVGQVVFSSKNKLYHILIAKG